VSLRGVLGSSAPFGISAAPFLLQLHSHSPFVEPRGALGSVDPTLRLLSLSSHPPARFLSRQAAGREHGFESSACQVVLSLS